MPWQLRLGIIFLIFANGCDAASPPLRRDHKAAALAPIEIKLADGRIITLQPDPEILATLSWSAQTLAEECRRSLRENFPAFGTLEVVRQGTNFKEYFPLDYFGKVVCKPPLSSPPPPTWRLAQERAGVNLWVEAVIPRGGIRDYPPMRGGDMVEISLCGVRLVANRTGADLPLHEDRIYHFDCEPTLFMNLLYPVARDRIVERPLLW
ncbi:MAG: hypothetical protein N3A66_12190, partial [Planctomycetota bacterium]|nr:hypothetical protein [Planctomycetota bacterium]